MLLDAERANAQIVQLTRQAAAARYAAGSLSAYRSRLRGAWSGGEAEEYARAAAELTRQCTALEGKLMALRTDLARAMEEILAEQALLLLGGESP